MNSGALLLDSKNQPLEAYPPELVELLAEGALSPDARRELDRLHREQKGVKCADHNLFLDYQYTNLCGLNSSPYLGQHLFQLDNVKGGTACRGG